MATRKKILNLTVVVSALGYFVDIYDLVLFSIVRIPSLRSLGVPEDQLLDKGVTLINLQMIGMLVGGILWGVLGDKKGRVSVLFGSIFMYSVANILNAFVQNVEMYGLLRFVAGVGLAGELGAAITLVSEVTDKESRGYATSIVAGVGVSGAILAAIIGEYVSWKAAYIVGGVLGLGLLVLRMKMFDSGMYTNLKKLQIRKGSFLSLFSTRDRGVRYLSCVLIGVPIWFVIGILITFAPEITKDLGSTGVVSAGTGILFAYAGLTVGDFASGILSQLLRSRRKIVFWFITMTALLILIYLYSRDMDPSFYYTVCFALGVAAGYWAVFVTIASEQFGTNMRATVTTTVPNLVRGAVVPLTLSFKALQPTFGLVQSALIVGFVTIGVAYMALSFLKETYGKDLDFIEHI